MILVENFLAPSRVCWLFCIHSTKAQAYYCPYQWTVRERRGTGLCSSSFLLFFFKYFLYFVYVDPKTHWSLPQMPLGTARHKAQKGGIYGHFPYATLFIHGVFSETNIRNDLPSSNTMWNDIAGREKPRGQHKRKTGDNKKGLQLQ